MCNVFMHYFVEMAKALDRAPADGQGQEKRFVTPACKGAGYFIRYLLLTRTVLKLGSLSRVEAGPHSCRPA